jgi:ferric-dicitrate binding protein FerR (iron transport regulator)
VFAVRTANAIVRVLGTTFSVRQYPHEHTSRVIVGEGKVAVQSMPSAVAGVRRAILTAHTMATIADSSIIVTRGILDYTEFSRGALVFNAKPLGYVVAELSHVYGVDIRVADTLLAVQPVIMEVSVAEQSVGQVLDLIGKVTQSHYHMDGRTYVIAPGRIGAEAGRAKPRNHVVSQPEKSYGK